MSDLDGVIRYYEGMLRKHKKRIVRLEARGTAEDSINMLEARRAVVKYLIVLDALNLLLATASKEGVK